MLINRRTIRIEWGDCDPANIVFYPRYFEWFDASASQLFERLGKPVQETFREHGVIGMALVDAHARFIIPSKTSDVLTIESGVYEWGKSSFKLQHKFYKDGQLALEGGETRVWVGPHPDDPNRMRGVPIAQSIKDGLS